MGAACSAASQEPTPARPKSKRNDAELSRERSFQRKLRKAHRRRASMSAASHNKSGENGGDGLLLVGSEGSTESGNSKSGSGGGSNRAYPNLQPSEPSSELPALPLDQVMSHHNLPDQTTTDALRRSLFELTGQDDPDLLQAVLPLMQPLSPKTRGTRLMSQGETARMMYVVDEGEFERVDGDGKGAPSRAAPTSPRSPRSPVERYTRGAVIGIDALRPNSSLRSSTIQAAVDGSTVWAINRVTFQSAVVKCKHRKSRAKLVRLPESSEGAPSSASGGGGTAYERRRRSTKDGLLSQVPMFAPLTMEQLISVEKLMKDVEFADGEALMRQGDVAADAFFVLVQGQLVVRDDSNGGSVVATLDPGAVVGEGSLLTGQPRSATVVASCKSGSVVSCKCLNRSAFEKKLTPIHEVLHREFQKRVLHKIPLFAQHMSFEEVQELFECLVTVYFPANRCIVREEVITDGQFFIIEKGRVRCTRVNTDRQEVTVLWPGDYFGEEQLLLGEPPQQSYFALDAVTCKRLDRAGFESLLGPLENVLRRNLSARQSLWQNKVDAAALIKLSDLKMVRNLGSGAFGNVDLVRHPVTGAMFAKKQIDKQLVEDMGLEDQVKNERDVMTELDSVLVARLVRTFQDPHSVFMLQEYCPGGTLQAQIRGAFDAVQSGLPEKHVRFFAANLVLAVEFLHRNKVCYRDLKPENVMLASNSYPKLIDFGTARKRKGSERLETLCGTPEFMSPALMSAAEVVASGDEERIEALEIGYGLEVDWWALAIFIYEASGCRPSPRTPALSPR